MIRPTTAILCLWLLGSSCIVQAAQAQEGSPTATPEPSEMASTPSATIEPAPSVSPTPFFSVVPSPTLTATVPSLRATVTARFLSCRYGPGPEYLYLYALRAGANISLIGRTNGDNWHWAWVDGRNRCWVNTSYLHLEGDWHQLPVVYPGLAKLPVSPYYPPTSVLSAVRRGNSVTIEWRDIRLRLGDEEDEFMQHYIVETWRCKSGVLLFEPLATNYPFITFVDEPGCTQASHGRIFVQEKHGFSGPTEIPWPAFQ